MGNFRRKVSRMREKDLDTFALTGAAERMGDVEREQLLALLPPGIGQVLPKDIETTKETVRTIEHLRDKVLRVIEEGLDDPDVRYDMAKSMSKFLFEQKRAVTGKQENTINVIFEGIGTGTKQPSKAVEPADYKIN